MGREPRLLCPAVGGDCPYDPSFRLRQVEEPTVPPTTPSLLSLERVVSVVIKNYFYYVGGEAHDTAVRLRRT